MKGLTERGFTLRFKRGEPVGERDLLYLGEKIERKDKRDMILSMI